MNLKLRLNGKMLLFVLGTTLLVSVLALGYISLELKKFSATNAEQKVNAQTEELAQSLTRELQTYYQATNVLASAFAQYNFLPEARQNVVLNQMLSDFLNQNTTISAVYTKLEINKAQTDEMQFTDSSASIQQEPFVAIQFATDLTVDNAGAVPENSFFDELLYEQVKNTKKNRLSEPFYASLQGASDSVLYFSMGVPVLNHGDFIGMIGVLIPVSNLNEQYSAIKPFNAGKVFVLSNQGWFVSHPESVYLGKSFNQYAADIESRHSVLDAVKRGSKTQFSGDDPISEELSLFSFVPVQITNSDSSWSIGVSAPMLILHERANRTFSFALFLSIVVLVIISTILLGISTSITKPLLKTTEQLKKVAAGDIAAMETIKFSIKDEISETAEAMNELTESLNGAAAFAKQIGQGNLSAEYKLLSDKDMLGSSLISMQKSLIKAREQEEIKRIEDEKRNWVTHGLAKFGEVIRQHNDDMERFTMNVLSQLIEYTGAAQGAMYVSSQIEDDSLETDSYELKAAMAYGKAVMLKKEINRGQELLGRAIEENKTIQLTSLPERYVALSPGMQDKARPNNLLVTPVTINDMTLGAFELLSYQKFEPYQIEFIEKLCENIASVISSVKTNIGTAKLLEQSQEQADELAQHEEEMRQNLEEMLATQEEAAKREESLKSHIKAIKQYVMVAELDMNGRIIDISPLMASAYGSSYENVIEKYFDVLVAQDSDSQNEFSAFWEKVVAEGYGQRLHKMVSRNKEQWIQETYQVIQRDRLHPIVQVVAVDKSKEKELHQLVEQELDRLK
ncbi:MAG: cache domain-containing protein [Salinivirgaceae bacterium]